MSQLELTELIREALADVDWSGCWPNQIDGRQVGEYAIRACPNWEGGSYIGSLYGRDGTVEYDIVWNYGQLEVFLR